MQPHGRHLTIVSLYPSVIRSLIQQAQEMTPNTPAKDIQRWEMKVENVAKSALEKHLDPLFPQFKQVGLAEEIGKHLLCKRWNELNTFLSKQPLDLKTLHDMRLLLKTIQAFQEKHPQVKAVMLRDLKAVFSPDTGSRQLVEAYEKVTQVRLAQSKRSGDTASLSLKEIIAQHFTSPTPLVPLLKVLFKEQNVTYQKRSPQEQALRTQKIERQLSQHNLFTRAIESLNTPPSPEKRLTFLKEFFKKSMYSLHAVDPRQFQKLSQAFAKYSPLRAEFNPINQGLVFNLVTPAELTAMEKLFGPEKNPQRDNLFTEALKNDDFYRKVLVIGLTIVQTYRQAFIHFDLEPSRGFGRPKPR